MQMEIPLSRQVTPEDAWRITCHEAGHAVAAVRNQIAFSHVERGDGEQGQMVFDHGPIENPTSNWTKEAISRWQQVYAAGAAAELLLFGDYRRYASSRDQRLHDKLEKCWCPDRSGGWEKDIQSALKLLDRESLEKVAEKLERRKKLSGEKVHEILSFKTSS
jgi:hypothetical protein